LSERLEDLDFVDDLCLLSQNFKDMNQKMQDLIKIAKGTGLKINSQKSKIM
jgi:Txe/YoeB family toxin of Txe-Axe toxin-antitoxin module